MSILADLARNRRAYRRYFDREEEREERSPGLPEPISAAQDAPGRLIGPSPLAEESGSYRLTALSGGEGIPASAAARSESFSLGREHAASPDPDEVVERLLSRLEREARLSSQELGEE